MSRRKTDEEIRARIEEGKKEIIEGRTVPRRQHLWTKHSIDPWQNKDIIETHFEKEIETHTANCVIHDCKNEIYATMNLSEELFCYICKPHFERYEETCEVWKKTNVATEWDNFVGNMDRERVANAGVHENNFLVKI